VKLLILNGFDRSGTSYIGGLLARHPDVNYFFQPFSSTQVHETQFEVWRKGFCAPEPERFLDSIQNGGLDCGFISSDWFDRYSSYSFDANRKVALIKDTKLHAKIGWLKGAFPEAVVYGIWRDPMAVLYSLIRNRFHLKWYGDEAFKKSVELIRTDPRLEIFMEHIKKPLCQEARMALIIAARTQLMMLELEDGEWLFYEEISEDPNSGLNSLCCRLGMSDFDFSRLIKKDYNVIGLPYQHKDLWKTHMPRRLLVQVEPIFRSMRREFNAA